MIRAEVTIFVNKSDPVQYLEHKENDIIDILWKNNVDVTKVIFQEENVDTSYSCYIGGTNYITREYK